MEHSYFRNCEESIIKTIFSSTAETSENVPAKDLITFYLTCVRPVAEYACPVFHDSLPQYLSQDLEKLQKRALRIIHPGLSYPEALSEDNSRCFF